MAKTIQNHKKAKKEEIKLEMDERVIQSVAANSMLGLFPGIKPGVRLPEDFDLKYDLIYAAANQTVLKFKGQSGDFKSPIEMRISVKHDPEINRNELAYNFNTCKFTVYTPLTEGQLNELIFDQGSKLGISKSDMIVKLFGDIIPSAMLKYFTTQAEIMTSTGVDSFKKKYLPKQFLNKKNNSKKTKKSRSL